MRRIIWDEMREMQARMDELFDEFFKKDPFVNRRLLGSGSSLPVERDLSTPLADFWETDKDFRVELDLPGIEKGNVKVNVSKGLLEIKAEKKREEKKDIKGVHHYERSYSGFYRAFSLPQNADTDKVDAKLENGVLKVVILKKELPEFKQKQIEVK